MRIATTAGLLVAGIVAASAAASALTPDEIKSTFGTGKPFTAVSTSGQAYTFTLKPDGTAIQVPKGKKSGSNGTWRVSDTGYCSKWGSGAEHCYTIEKNGTKYTVLDAGRHVISNWTP